MSTIHGAADVAAAARASGGALSVTFGSDEGATLATFTEAVTDADLGVRAARADETLEAAAGAPAAIFGRDDDAAVADAPGASVGAGNSAVAAGAVLTCALGAVRASTTLVVLARDSTRAAARSEGVERGR